MKILEEAIYHVPKDEYCYPLNENSMMVVIRVRRGDILGGKLVYTDRYSHENYSPPVNKKELEFYGSDHLFDYWRCHFEVEKRRPKYLFLLETNTRVYWYSKLGLTKDQPAEDWFEFPYIPRADLPSYPDWLKEAVFYQIAVDRFQNGNPSNNPPNTLAWGETPTMTTFFGGDLEGVIEKLDYLSDLGVNAIYFNPLFMSPSTFKYDTEDYYQIDPSFGGNEAFELLIKACHEKGIKVILDAVFNHTGLRFKPFKDVCQKGIDSEFYSWFEIHSLPIQTDEPFHNYDTFSYTARMPKLRHDHPDVRKFLLNVTEYWTNKGIDGWRIDVANEIDHEFWREFRKLVKSINPEAFILGEIWLDGTTWLRGDQFDSITNYLFRAAVLDYFGNQKIGVTTFDEKLLSSRVLYREDTNQHLFNLIGSHDVPRFLSLCGGSLDRAKLATVFLFTYPGIPMVYYGDEIGMTGGGDFVQSRRCMIWDEKSQELDLLKLYKTCIHWRKTLEPLKSGIFKRIYLNESQNIYGFSRELENESVWAYFHNGKGKEQVTVPIPEGWKVIDLLSGNEIEHSGSVFFPLTSYAYQLLHLMKE